jgi:hypothetical protein
MVCGTFNAQGMVGEPGVVWVLWTHQDPDMSKGLDTSQAH